MRNKKTFKKLAFMLLMSIIMPLTSANVNPNTTKAYAAGNETWNAGVKYTSTYVFNDCNYTPCKTIGSNGTLVILGSFRRADTSSSQIRLTIKVLDFDTKQVLSTVSVDDRYNNAVNTTEFCGACINVHAGQRIQIFVDASSVSNPPGYYRTAWITYSAYIS